MNFLKCEFCKCVTKSCNLSNGWHSINNVFVKNILFTNNDYYSLIQNKTGTKHRITDKIIFEKDKIKYINTWLNSNGHYSKNELNIFINSSDEYDFLKNNITNNHELNNVKIQLYGFECDKIVIKEKYYKNYLWDITYSDADFHRFIH
jgi:hypothetical protein